MAGCESSHSLPIIVKRNGHLVAHVCEHSEANAKLIAAAPDLLAALRDLADVLQYIGDTDADDVRVLESARAVIAEASQ